MNAFVFTFNNKPINEDSEENKIYWIVVNSILNSFGFELGEYDFMGEAILFARGKNYFPELEEKEFLELARKHEYWNKFEKSLSESLYSHGCSSVW